MSPDEDTTRNQPPTERGDETGTGIDGPEDSQPVDSELAPDEGGEIPGGRISRTAKVTSAVGGQGARYAATKAANLGRSKEKAEEKMETRHLEAAMKMVSVLGEMKGAAMKMGQLASFIDSDFLPPDFRETYQEQLAQLRSKAPAMPWDKVKVVLEEEYETDPESVFESIEHEAFAAASIGQVHRARLTDGTEVAVKIQYPGIADALESDLANAGMLVRLAKAIAPGLDAKEIAEELKERTLEELDYEFEAQNQRMFARAYDGHPFVFIPKVHADLSRRRVLVSDFVEGHGFDVIKTLPQGERDIFGEIIFRFSFGSIFYLQHFNADTHPGNYLLMKDGRVAFLDFGMTKQVTRGQIQMEQAVVDAAFRDDPEGLLVALTDLGFIKNPGDIDPGRLLEHARHIGGWYMEDADTAISPERVMKMIEVTSDPRNEYFGMLRKETLPADELLGRRMESGLMAVLAQLQAKANWYQITREWIYDEEPKTVLGEAEREYFAGKGMEKAPGLPVPPS